METQEKKDRYQAIVDYVKSYEGQDVYLLTLLSDLPNMLRKAFSYMDWVGFYLFDEKKDQLYLGPYNGEAACQIIPIQKGVCGKCAREKKTQLVDDVTQLSYHIACSSLSRSEVVVPIYMEGKKLYGVLDIDSNALKSFDAIDSQYLKSIGYLLAKLS